MRDAVDSIYSRYCDNFSVSPRKSLEISSFVVIRGEELLCYFLGENSWCTLRKIPSEYGKLQHLFPCKGDLYSTARPKSVIVSYNPHTNSWTRLTNIGEDTYLLKIYVGNDESYALLSDVCTSCIDSHIRSLENDLCDRAHSTFISKYKPEPQSWQKILSLHLFYHFVRRDFCIVASEHFIYFIGGLVCVNMLKKYLSDVDRYDLSKHQWKKVADIRIAKRRAIIKPIMPYGSMIWTSCSQENLLKVLRLQKRVARIILDAKRTTPSVALFNSLKWIPFYAESYVIDAL